MSVDEELPKNNRIQESSSCGSLYEPAANQLLSPVSESGRKDQYIEAATSLKESHIGKIEERPDSEDTASEAYPRKSGIGSPRVGGSSLDPHSRKDNDGMAP